MAASIALGVVPEHDDRLPHPGLGERVEDVLEDRPPADRREQLAATEARAGPGGQDESHGSTGHIGIFPPPCGQSSLAPLEADHPSGRPPLRRSPSPMMTEPDPTLDDVPLESAVQAEAEAAEPEVTETRPPRPPLDDRTQLAVGAGLAVAIIGLLGSVFGAWELIFGGLILIAAGLVAAGAAYVSSGREAGAIDRRARVT